METRDYLKILREEIHSTVIATVDERGLPAARVIDIMLVDDNSLYFITAKGKEFYRQLMEKPYVAVSGMCSGEGTMNKKAISIRGKVRNIGSGKLLEVFGQNPYMAEIYPSEESRMALEVFQVYEGSGDFIKKYGGPYMQDMYSAGFNPYPDEESKWGYWSKQAILAGAEQDVTPLHRKLLKALDGKKSFLLSTNVDDQFSRAGYPVDRIFATQGSYDKIQCKKGCHQKIYDGVEMFRQMDQARKDCKVPSYMVPKCPVCGGPMEMNLRCDQYFVQDEEWYAAEKRFGDFLSECTNRKTVLLELGGAGLIRLRSSVFLLKNW